MSPSQARISGLENDLASMRVDIKASQDKVRSANANIAALEKVGCWKWGGKVGLACHWAKPSLDEG